MASHRVTYPPLDVPKPIADGVWIVDSGPIRPAGMTLPTRMTVISLDDGGLLLHSPTRFDEALRRALEAIGPIRHLVAPNVAHWSYVAQWQRACAEAKTWAAPGLGRRGQVRRAGLRIDAELGRQAPPAWSAEIEQVVVPGGAGFLEIAFFHRRSRTLLLTDLVVNLERRKAPLSMRIVMALSGSLAPHGMAPIYLRGIIRMRRKSARDAAERLVALDPERVIFAHGQWFETDGAARLRRSLRWLLG